MRDLPRYFRLRDGTPIFVRLFRPSDREQIRLGYTKLSSRSRYRRFLNDAPRLSEPQLTSLSDVDGVNRLAICAGAIREGGWEAAAIARFVRQEAGARGAEAAVTVIDAYQHRGLGTLLVDLLTEQALERGVERFTGHLLADNLAMLRILQHRSVEAELEDGATLSFGMPLRSPVIGLREITDRYGGYLEAHGPRPEPVSRLALARSALRVEVGRPVRP